MIQASVNHVADPYKMLTGCFVETNFVGEYKFLANKLMPALRNPVLLQPRHTETLHLTQRLQTSLHPPNFSIHSFLCEGNMVLHCRIVEVIYLLKDQIVNKYPHSFEL